MLQMTNEQASDILRLFSAFAALGVSGDEFETLVEIAEKGNEVAKTRLTGIKREVQHLLPWVSPVAYSGAIESPADPV